jgi:hypothetical protein
MQDECGRVDRCNFTFGANPAEAVLCPEMKKRGAGGY